MIYVADFETNNHAESCHVWAWMKMNVYTSALTKGTDIESFVEDLSQESFSLVWFHNLGFDGEFLLYYLLSNGWKWQEDRRKLSKKTFTTLISDMGKWYQVIIVHENGNRTELRDSLKVWPFSIEDLAKTLKMDVQKGEIDYNLFRPLGYEPTEQEWDYIYRDVKIAQTAMKESYKIGDEKMTAGANAMEWFMRSWKKKDWGYHFPVPTEAEDAFVRRSYRGGWTYLNPKFRDREIGFGIVLDENSMYPDKMRNYPLPYGSGVYYEGKYKEDKIYTLYVQRFIAIFKVKKGMFPTIQLKNTPGYVATQYVESTNGEPVELTLCSCDLELFLKHYDVEAIDYLDGYKYRAKIGIFADYIDYWMSVKEKATIEGDMPMRGLAKLKQNGLYGKFAKKGKGRSKIPYLGEDNIVHYQMSEEEDRGLVYIPIGAFITAWARCDIIGNAQKVHDRFIYADTDSMHLKGGDVPEGIEVHPTHLGKWKHEGDFVRARYLGPKCYCEEMVQKDGTIKAVVTCAGMPKSSKEGVNLENFRYHLRVGNKLVPKHVPGGVILQETTFEIKNR